MKALKTPKGFVLMQIILVCLMVVMAVFSLSLASFLTGNFWYTEQGVLEKIRLNNPKATLIIDHSREIWSYSEIIVEENGESKTYYLDTDMFFNYEIRPTRD